MRRLLSGALVLALAAPAGAAEPTNQRRLRDWHPMSVAVGGNALIYAIATKNTMPGGYVVHRTDTYIVGIRGSRFAAATGKTSAILMRTSAGAMRGGPLQSDALGRHVLVATGTGFSPQVAFCCTTDGLPTPIEASGAPDAPITLAATLEWPVAWMLQTDGGRLVLAGQEVTELSPYPVGPPRRIDLGAELSRRLAAIAPGGIAWLETTTGLVRVSRPPATGAEVPAGVAITPRGYVRRLLVSDGTLAVVNDLPGGGRELVRYDAPDWLPTVVWSGAKAPTSIALSGATLVFGDGVAVMQHTPTGGLQRVVRLRTPAVALGTDGSRVAVIERLVIPWRGRRIKQTALTLWPVVAPGAVSRARAGR